MSHLSLYLTGHIEVQLDGRDITREFRTEKERALLAYLAVESDRSHWRDGLAELFWPERPAGVARTNLRQALTGIRRALNDRQNTPPFILSDDETIQFNQRSSYDLDVVTFKEHIEAVQTHPHHSLETCSTCVRHLEKAVETYRGEFMEGFYLDDSQRGQEWITFEREQLYTQMLSAMQNLMSYYTLQGDHEQALTFAQQLVSLAPYEESAHRAMMQMFSNIGRRSAALEQYQTVKRILKDELGVEPSAETTALYNLIKAGTLAPPTQPLSAAVPVQVPVPITSFIGRQNEVAWFEGCLANPTCRLITLVGMPGSGKSRLAMEVATRYSQYFPDGVKFYRMEEVRDPALLPSYLARGLGVDLPISLDPLPALCNLLTPLNVLLVLDGFEHLVGATEMLLEMLRRAEHLKLLITTRRRLDYQSVCLTELAGLQYPPHDKVEAPEQYPAIELFLNRTTRSQIGFQLDGDKLTHLIRICRLVDGLPLGLEVAAAALRDYSLRQIADLLEKSPASLAVGLKDVPDRHRSLWNLMEHAWGQLTTADQSALASLSVFHDRFDPPAAQAVTGHGLPVLSRLSDQSILTRPTPYTFALHPLVQQYSFHRLQSNPSEAARFQEAHCKYYLEYLRQRQLPLKDYSEVAVEELRQVMDDLHQALNWASLHGRSLEAAEGQAMLKHYYESCMVVKQKDCIFWKVELALNEENPGLVNLPVLRNYLTRDSWCCGRLDCLSDSETGFLMEDEGHQIIEANYQASQILGYPRGELLGMSIASWAPGLLDNNNSPEVSLPVDFIRGDGHMVSLQVTRSLVSAVGDRFGLINLQVRGEGARLIEGIPMAGFDPLTKLPNRDWFRTNLMQYLSRASRELRPFAIFLVEMQGIRTVNELFGKEYGDKVVLESAQRLRRRTRTGDTVARFSTQDFAMLLDGLAETESAERVALKVIDTLSEPLDLGGHSINLSIHIGVVMSSGGADGMDTMLTNAEDALKQSRKKGDCAYHIFGLP
ncbi:MAG TPA: diguanylate cyclase [Anaerolineales bacterium]|nr:diguanylate cyclase [Anaerolineales bacterium]